MEEKGFKIIKGDEVNCIHYAIMRTLTIEQMIILRDKLIRRTPAVKNNFILSDVIGMFLPPNEDGYCRCANCGKWNSREEVAKNFL